MNSRQAINLLKGLEKSLDDYCELNDEGKAAFRMAITALELFGNSEQLPSAQPEIIRCKDCKWSDWYTAVDGKWYCHCLETGAAGRTEDDYCSYAEREEGETDAD